MSCVNREAAIAARIRSLIGGRDHGKVEATAHRLRVSDVSLRMSIDEREPHPTMEVLIALVREDGVDPCWLVTGEYDATTHRAAVEDEAGFSRQRIATLIERQLAPLGTDGIPLDLPLRLEA